MRTKINKDLPETISWKSQNHTQATHSPLWYLLFSLVSLGLILFGLYNHSVIMVVTFCVIIASILLLNTQVPKTITYKINSVGIMSGEILYPYKIIKKFWLVYNPPITKTLNFETTAYLNNRISIQLGSQDPVAVKLYLSQYLPEDLDRTESLSETLARTLKI